MYSLALSAVPSHLIPALCGEEESTWFQVSHGLGLPWALRSSKTLLSMNANHAYSVSLRDWKRSQKLWLESPLSCMFAKQGPFFRFRKPLHAWLAWREHWVMERSIFLISDSAKKCALVFVYQLNDKQTRNSKEISSCFSIGKHLMILVEVVSAFIVMDHHIASNLWPYLCFWVPSVVCSR